MLNTRHTERKEFTTSNDELEKSSNSKMSVAWSSDQNNANELKEDLVARLLSKVQDEKWLEHVNIVQTADNELLLHGVPWMDVHRFIVELENEGKKVEMTRLLKLQIK